MFPDEDRFLPRLVFGVIIVVVLVGIPSCVYDSYLEWQLKQEEVKIRQLYQQRLAEKVNSADFESFDKMMEQYMDRQKTLALQESANKSDNSGVATGIVVGTAIAHSKR